ncbi:fungal hydrophobin-domain-containing protein [Fomes fomentarius]|nr:fungal hydrophobin-domain-containing protein [Fomes fomentarius]
MFSRTSIYCALSLSILATAMPNNNGHTTTPVTTPTKTVTVTAPASTPTSGSCSTGPVQCCTSTESASSPSGTALLGLLGIVVQGVDVLLGLGCSPISVIGVGGSTCSSNVVCCQNNAVGGLISIGCVPITL